MVLIWSIGVALPSASSDTMYQAPWRTSLSAGDELQPAAKNETASSISGESFIGSSKISRGKSQAGNGPVLPCRQPVHQFSPAVAALPTDERRKGTDR